MHGDEVTTAESPVAAAFLSLVRANAQAETQKTLWLCCELIAAEAGYL